MKIKVLASGSTGNCTFIELNNTRFLIDIGISCKTVEEKLKAIQIKPATIDYILITHCHEDHVRGLFNFSKKYQAHVYFSHPIFSDKNFINITEEKMLNDVKVTSFKTSHDIAESYGFLLEYQDESVVYLTDTGYVNEKIQAKIKNKKVYIMESNHDVTMLMNTRRTHSLKMRILSDNGHLSNETCAHYLGKLIGEQTKKIILAHLSEEANTPEQALAIMQKKITNIPIIVAEREGCEMIEI